MPPAATTASSQTAARSQFLDKIKVQLGAVDPILRQIGTSVDGGMCHHDKQQHAPCECDGCPWLVDESAMTTLINDLGGFLTATASPLQLVFVIDALYGVSGPSLPAIKPGLPTGAGIGIRALRAPRSGASKRTCWQARLHSSIDIALWLAQPNIQAGMADALDASSRSSEGSTEGEIDIYRIEEIQDERQRPCVIRWL